MFQTISNKLALSIIFMVLFVISTVNAQSYNYNGYIELTSYTLEAENPDILISVKSCDNSAFGSPDCEQFYTTNCVIDQYFYKSISSLIEGETPVKSGNIPYWGDVEVFYLYVECKSDVDYTVVPVITESTASTDPDAETILECESPIRDFDQVMPANSSIFKYAGNYYFSTQMNSGEYDAYFLAYNFTMYADGTFDGDIKCEKLGTNNQTSKHELWFAPIGAEAMYTDGIEWTENFGSLVIWTNK